MLIPVLIQLIQFEPVFKYKEVTLVLHTKEQSMPFSRSSVRKVFQHSTKDSESVPYSLYSNSKLIVASSTIPAHALYFAGYEMAKRGLSPGTPLEEKGPVVHFLAGVWADVCGAIVWVPQVKTQHKQSKNQGRRKTTTSNPKIDRSHEIQRIVSCIYDNL